MVRADVVTGLRSHSKAWLCVTGADGSLSSRALRSYARRTFGDAAFASAVAREAESGDDAEAAALLHLLHTRATSGAVHRRRWRLLRRASASGRFGRPLRAQALIDPALRHQIRTRYAQSEALLAARLRWQDEASQGSDGWVKTGRGRRRRHGDDDRPSQTPAHCR